MHSNKKARVALDFFLKSFFCEKNISKTLLLVSDNVDFINYSFGQLIHNQSNVKSVLENWMNQIPKNFSLDYTIKQEDIYTPTFIDFTILFNNYKEFYFDEIQKLAFREEKEDEWKLVSYTVSFFGDKKLKNFDSENQEKILTDDTRIGMIGCYLEEGLPLWYINPNLVSNLGFYDEKFLYSNIEHKLINLVNVEEREEVYKKVKTQLKKNNQFQIQCKFIKKDGTNLPVSVIGRKVIADKNRNAISIIYFEGNKKISSEKQRLRDELSIAKSSLQIAIQQSGAKYSEYDISKDELLLSDVSMKYFGMPKILKNYPDCLFEKELIYPDDCEIYYENINTLFSGKKDNICFEVRLKIASGKYLWHRKFFSAVYDENGKKTKYVGTIFCIETEVQNRTRYRLEMERMKVFDSNYVAYITFNVTTYEIIEHEPNGFPIRKFEIGENFNRFLKSLCLNIIDQDQKKEMIHIMKQENLLSAFIKGETPSISYRRIGKYGKGVTWVESKITLMKSPENQDVIAFVSTYDINEKKEIETLFDFIINKQNDSVMRLDKISRQCTIFARENNYMGFPKGFSCISFEKYDKIINSLKHDNQKTSVINSKSCDIRFETLEPGKEYSTLVEIENPKKQKAIMKSSEYLTENKESIFYYGDDVTEIIQQERKNQNELKKAIRIAEEANRAKTEFLSAMSHDIRTPMSTIIGLSKIGIGENQNSVDFEYFSRILDSSEYLLSLVNDILDMQKIELQGLTLDPTTNNFSKTIKKIESLVSSSAKDRNISFKIHKTNIPDNILLKYDEKRFQQLIINLVNNAIKYTHENGFVTWNIEINQKNERTYTLINTIEDNGVGMSEKFQQNMFKPFFKEINKFSEIEGGTGLGLAITKILVNSMRGTIKCSSKLGVGTTFTINLEFEKGDYSELEKTDFNNIKNYLKSKGKKVLLCEDHPINANIFKKILMSYGLDVDIAENGEIGVKKFKQSHYDCIFMDIRMPIMNGYEATKIILELDKTIPIIALSASAFIEDKKKCLEAGMVAHLSKPIENNALNEVLFKLFGNLE